MIKNLCAPDDYSKKQTKIQYFKQFQSPTMITLLELGSSRTQFGLSINVWRLAEDTLNITCNVLYCNHQVYRDFLITLYNTYSYTGNFSGIMNFVSLRTLILPPVCSQRNALESYDTAAEASAVYLSRP